MHACVLLATRSAKWSQALSLGLLKLSYVGGITTVLAPFDGRRGFERAVIRHMQAPAATGEAQPALDALGMKPSVNPQLAAEMPR